MSNLRDFSQIIEKLEQICLNIYPKSGSHDWNHIQRVRKLCLQIGRQLNADLLVLEAAALLHDISHQLREKHAERSSVEAEKILREVGFPEEKIPKIVDAIREHSFSSGLKPQSLESKILSDADKLDALGAIGIYRAIAYSIEHGRSINGFVEHVFEKLLKLPEYMETEIGRKLAAQRARFLRDFVDQLLKEI